MQGFIVAENCYKQKILIDPNDVIGKTILHQGIYDKTGLYFIEQILSKLKPSVIFDIGASIGNHALRMSQHCQSLYLFEPQATLVAQLKTTASLNNLHHWHIFNVGLSDEEKKLTLYKNLRSNIETSFVAELKGDDFLTEESQVCIGDEIVKRNTLSSLDFIKIDVEGFEAKVILGLQHSIQKFRPVIFMEWDKEITKEQFRKYDVFSKVFANYEIKAITRSPYASSLHKRILRKMRRIFARGMNRKRWTIGAFDPKLNYRHILLIPKEKMTILHDG